MKISKIEGIEAFKIVKIVEAQDVEKATLEGWRLLGCVEQEGVSSSSYGPITHRPLFVLGKSEEDTLARMAVERDTARKEAERVPVFVQWFEYAETLITNTLKDKKATKDELWHALDRVRRLKNENLFKGKL